MAKKKEKRNNENKIETKQEEKEEMKQTEKTEKEKAKTNDWKNQMDEILLKLPLIIVFILIMILINKGNKPKNEYDDQKGKTTYKVGETFQNKHLQITFANANTNYTNYNPMIATVKEGYKIVQFKFTGKNIGEKEETLGTTNFNCFADNNPEDKFYGVQETSSNPNLSSGESFEIYVQCQVPENASHILVNYKPYGAEKTYEFIAK